ncbi:hypothetical protein SLS62_007209 [Diatrype stigma]|uniref:Uncharacterized protein n=1 Tax=Diatrype stigma TaxID=117547 RepID=A0AAN9UM41_9PEZI
MMARAVEEGQRQQHSHRSASIVQPGSIYKRWDQAELRRCRATGRTTEQYATFDLGGEIHPVFTNWTTHHSPGTGGDDAEEDEEGDALLFRELMQPLLLAGRILEAVGLPWLSDFFVHDGDDADADADDDAYDDGRDPFESTPPSPSPSSAYSQISGSSGRSHNRNHKGVGIDVPPAVARHHRATWASPELKQKWLDDTRRELRSPALALSVEWQLDGSMFGERGWVGYTCRHPRTAEMTLESLDSFDVIAGFDQDTLGREEEEEEERGKYKYRALSVLVMSEFPARLCELRSRGEERGEEYLLTAFMATVTILHE